MGGLQSLQNNLQGGPSSGLQTTIPNSVGLSGNLQTSGLPSNLQSGGLLNNFSNMPTGLTGNSGLSTNGPLNVPVGLSIAGGMPGTGGMLVSSGLSTSGGMHSSGGISVNSAMPSGLIPNSGVMTGNDGGHPGNLQGGRPGKLSDNSSLPPRPNPLGAVDPLSTSNENEAIKSLLRQLANKQQSQQVCSIFCIFFSLIIHFCDCFSSIPYGSKINLLILSRSLNGNNKTMFLYPCGIFSLHQ